MKARRFSRVRAAGLRPWVALLSAIAALGCALAPGVAFADGDPASDVLLSQSLFLPSDTGGPATGQRELTALMASARRGGSPIRVAIVPSAYDLGSVTPLWRRPRVYAQFLGTELSDSYTGRLLVVMPNGFGFFWLGHATAPTYRLLGNITPGAGGTGLLAATRTAVTRIAGQVGVTLRAPSPPAAATGQHYDPVAIVLPAVAALLLAVALGRVVLRRRARRPPAIAPRARRARTSTPRLGWVLPGAAVLCCIAIGVPLAVVRLRHASASVSVPAQSAPFTWPAKQRPAPNFELTNQAGDPISLSAYRGRPVILTFIDPLCRNLCPLAAQVLNQADRQLPASQRPVIIAVSVDIYADTRADLYEDFSRWRLVPQWQWAVGKRAQLASVWRNYKIGVSVLTKQIAGTTIHEISHDEVAYVIDPNGYERALFVWPYYPQDVEQTLRALSRS